jgi:hypothetical protein
VVARTVWLGVEIFDEQISDRKENAASKWQKRQRADDHQWPQSKRDASLDRSARSDVRVFARRQDTNRIYNIVCAIAGIELTHHGKRPECRAKDAAMYE